MSAAITIDNLSKTFNSKVVLDNVSLEVPEGQIFGFLGPNGAGKTTTIRCLMDYIHPTSGTISIMGADAQRDSAAIKQKIGYLSSDLQLYPHWNAKTHIDFLAAIKGRGSVDKMVAEFNLDTNKPVNKLSTGNKQKLAIILAFLGSPKLLIMDEPTRGLDPLLQNQLYELLRDFAKDGGSVFFSSHNLTEVQALCDDVGMIKAGKIVAAKTMKDLLASHVHAISVTASQKLNFHDFERSGVELIASEGNTLHLKVRGPIDDVIKKLGKYNVTDLEVTRASLEDIFMELY
jgi:ABC-2 type transport system ATP-binding protein